MFISILFSKMCSFLNIYIHMAKHIVNTLHPFCENTTTKYIISISSMNITAWLNWSERFQNLSLLLQFQNKEVSLFFILTYNCTPCRVEFCKVRQCLPVKTLPDVLLTLLGFTFKPIHRGRCYMFLYTCWGNSRCQNITSDLLPCSNLISLCDSAFNTKQYAEFSFIPI